MERHNKMRTTTHYAVECSSARYNFMNTNISHKDANEFRISQWGNKYSFEHRIRS